MTQQTQKILIVDDHQVVLEGVKTALQKEPGFEIVGTAADGLKAVEMARALKPDIIIMDNSMPTLDGLEATRRIKGECSNAKIIIFSMLSDKELVGALFREGISAYVLKGQSFSDMIMALKAVAEGGVYYGEEIGGYLRSYMSDLASAGREEGALDLLSAREKEVFPLLADGLTSKAIARRLTISPKTVETHKYNIMDKLKATSIAQLTKIAVKHGLIEI